MGQMQPKTRMQPKTQTQLKTPMQPKIPMQLGTGQLTQRLPLPAVAQQTVAKQQQRTLRVPLLWRCKDALRSRQSLHCSNVLVLSSKFRPSRGADGSKHHGSFLPQNCVDGFDLGLDSTALVIYSIS